MNSKIIFVSIALIIAMGFQHSLNLILKELREIKEILKRKYL